MKTESSEQFSNEEVQKSAQLTEMVCKLFNGYSIAVIEVSLINAIGTVYINLNGHEAKKEIAADIVDFAALCCDAAQQVLNTEGSICTLDEMREQGLIKESH